MQKLKLQYFGRLIQRAYSLEKTLMLRKGWRQMEKEIAMGEIIRISLLTQWI